jgi:PAS domain S-box-containing protein
MKIDKNQYIRNQIEILTQSWLSSVFKIAVIIFLLLGIMDYFATPENFRKFMIYRIIISLLLASLCILNKIKRNLSYQYALSVIGIVLTVSVIELMILSFGGHKSFYYVGINLVTISVLGFLPLTSSLALLCIILIHSIYFFPILLFDKITDMTIFVINNAFIFATSATAFALRFLSQKSLINELTLQYELDKDKHKLETYSTKLEDLVQERTKELTVSEQRFRALFDNANDGVVVLDKNGIIINMNNKFCEMHSFYKDALIGTHFRLLEVEDNKDENKERLKRILNGEPLVFETEHYKRDGTKILLEVSSKGISIGGDLYVQSFHRDITEKKAIQEQLIQSQKMESIGALAGGIAHNFNNLLTAILGYAELLQEYSDLDAESKQKVNNIESSARKAGVLISKLLSFSRKERFELLPLNLNDVINDSVKLLEGVLDKRIGLKTNLSEGIPNIEGDPNQLEQVIMNFMVNARDARRWSYNNHNQYDRG